MKCKLSIQEKLKDLRIEKGLSLQELSEQTGISRASLGNYETDDYKEISHKAIITLADFYGVTSDYLLGLTENREQHLFPIDELGLDDETQERRTKIAEEIEKEIEEEKDKGYVLQERKQNAPSSYRQKQEKRS